MAAQYRKAEKPKIIGYFPTKTYGQDGDTVIVQIRGKGVFFCVKAAGLWYAQTTMQPLSKIDTAYIKDLQSDKLTLKRIENAGINTDKFVVLKDNSIKYRTGDNILNDLDLVKVNYKTAYCSLGQYSSKQSCEANGGTWYYSENDSHDSISSTPENQLLTTGQKIGIMDSEPTLLYDGSTLTVKHNRDYDNNWQTSEHSGPLIHIDYNYSGYESGNDTIAQCLHIDGDFTIGMPTGDNAAIYGLDLDLNADNVTHGAIVTQYGIDMNLNAGTSGVQNNYGLTLSCLGADYNNGLRTTIEDGTGYDIKCQSSANTSDYFQITTGAEGATTILTVDADTAVAHLTLQPDGDLKLTPSTGIMYLYDNDNAVDYAKFTVGTNGDLTLQTVDANASAANLTLDVDGDIELNADGGNVTFEDGLATKVDFDLANNRYNFFYDGTNFFRITVGGNSVTSLATTDADGTVGHLSLIPDGSLIFDPADGKYIAKNNGTEFSAADSAYAGMILGYTSIQNLDDDAGDNTITIGNTFAVIETVAGTKANVSFVAPPSGKVEIVFSALCYAVSKSFYFSLSDNATYNELNEIHTYDGFSHRPDESDYSYVTFRWTVTGLTAGTSYQYWIGAKCTSASGYIYHGESERFGVHSPPIIVKAVALPATIVTGE